MKVYWKAEDEGKASLLVDEWKDCYFYVVESGRLFVALKKDKTTMGVYHANSWVKAEEVRDG